MNMGNSRPIISLDSTFVKYHYYTGVSFLVIGVALLYIILRVIW
jgi:hypothetical protein